MAVTKLASIKNKMPVKSISRQEAETKGEWLQRVWYVELIVSVPRATMGVSVSMKRSIQGACWYILEILS